MSHSSKQKQPQTHFLFFKMFHPQASSSKKIKMSGHVSNFILCSDSRFNHLSLTQYHEDYFFTNNLHIFAKGGARPNQQFINYCTINIKNLIKNKQVDNNSPLFIKLCIGVNSLLEKNINGKIIFNTLSDITVEQLSHKLLEIKKSLLISFPGAYVSFTTIPTVDLSKFNNWLAGKDVSTPCCPSHSKLEYTHDFWAEKKQSMVHTTLDVPPTSPSTQKSISTLISETNIFIRNENRKPIPGYISYAYTVNLEQDTLKKNIRKPNATHRLLHPNSTLHQKKNISFTTYKSNLVDGIHPTHCMKLKWLKLIQEKFEGEKSRLECIPDVVRMPPDTNTTKSSHEYHLYTSEYGNSHLSVHYNFFDISETSDFFTLINNSAKWRKIGKRESYYISPYPYQYAGITHPPEVNYHPIIDELMCRISNICKAEINSVLINRYEDGSSHIPWHQDNEPELGENPTICSLSLGASRIFEIMNKSTKKINQFEMHNSTLIVMSGAMQKQYYHRVPMDESCEAARLNLTFRYVYQIKK